MRRLLFLSVLMMPLMGAAQTTLNRFGGVTWNLAKPTSNADFVSDLSSQGVMFTYREFLGEHLAVGADFQYQIYNGYTPRQTYTNSTGAFTTDYYNYVDGYSFALGADYFLNKQKKLMPFAGLGLGAANLKFASYYNIYAISDKSWGMLLRPQAGVVLKLGKQQAWGLLASVFYDYTSCKSEQFNFSNYSTLGFRVGLMYLDGQ